jgi:hypothetical protein
MPPSSQSPGRGPRFDFGLLQPAVASPPILPCRLPPLPCPLLVRRPARGGGVVEAQIERGSGGAFAPKTAVVRRIDPSRTACLRAAYRPDALESCLCREPWRAVPLLSALGRASWAWKLPAIPAVSSRGIRLRNLAARPAPASLRLPASSRACALALLRARLDRAHLGPSRGGCVPLDEAHRQRPTDQSTGFRSRACLPLPIQQPSSLSPRPSRPDLAPGTRLPMLHRPLSLASYAPLRSLLVYLVSSLNAWTASPSCMHCGL